jgi:hypothetical protein
LKRKLQTREVFAVCALSGFMPASCSLINTDVRARTQAEATGAVACCNDSAEHSPWLSAAPLRLVIFANFVVKITNTPLKAILTDFKRF